MLPRTVPLVLLLCACSAGTEASSSAASPKAVVEVPKVVTGDGGTDPRPEGGLRLVYQVSPATEEAAEQALARTRERLDAQAFTVPLSLHREGLAIVLEIGPCSEADARPIKAAMVARGGLEIARLADEGDPLAALRSLAPPRGIEVDTESVPVGSGVTAVVVYAHIDPAPNRRGAAQRLTDWVTANVGGVERLVVGPIRNGGRQRLRTFVLAEEPQPLEVSEAAVVDDGIPSVEVSLTSAGARVFGRTTADNIDHRLALLLDGKVLLAPRVMERIAGGRLRITLGASSEPARAAVELVQRLRLGGTGPALELAREELFGD